MQVARARSDKRTVRSGRTGAVVEVWLCCMQGVCCIRGVCRHAKHMRMHTPHEHLHKSTHINNPPTDAAKPMQLCPLQALHPHLVCLRQQEYEGQKHHAAVNHERDKRGPPSQSLREAPAQDGSHNGALQNEQGRGA